MTTADLLQGLDVGAYGNSYVAEPSGWSYLNLLADRHNWRVRNGSLGGTRANDAAAAAIAAGSPHRWNHGHRQIAIVDASTNDMYSAGMGGITGYRNAMRALLAWLAIEGPNDDQAATCSGSWSFGTGQEWSNGGVRVGGPTATLNTYGRPGRWAVGYYGLAEGTGRGAKFDIYAGNTKVGAMDSDLACKPPNPTSPPTYDGGPRNWTACASVVTVPAPASSLELRRVDDRGGPWLDWWGRIDDNPVTAPTILCVSPVYSPPAGYALSGLMSDQVVDAYATVLGQVAAEVGPNVHVVDVRPRWDANAMVRNDHMHPNQAGNLHIAAAIEDALAGLAWTPYTNNY